ncbi:hypothetical protein IEQ34_000190 [Dendrobium chrysotoxum]|uniref:Uncharacterized protein n=1 Tax=Dendrobium chrysotoxum TaxID=161865 RepID=A0AAV7HPU0_DENCH|nr:hypothetical protein IEQ34_000190 [Dendrobium chrysotoxum]
MKVVRNNLYELRDNLSLALEMNEVVISDWEVEVTAPTVMESFEVMEECGVEVRLELSLGLSSCEVECRK